MVKVVISNSIIRINYMSSQELTKILYSVLESEKRTNDLTNIPEDLYRNITDYINSINSVDSNNVQTIQKMVNTKEKEILSNLSQILLRIRLTKALNDQNNTNANLLTNEEKYVLEPLLNASKRNVKLLKAINNGSLSFLHGLNGHEVNQYQAVKFLEDSPSAVGIDSRTYGPFKQGDVAILPTDNAKLLIQQEKVEELNMEL